MEWITCKSCAVATGEKTRKEIHIALDSAELFQASGLSAGPGGLQSLHLEGNVLDQAQTPTEEHQEPVGLANEHTIFSSGNFIRDGSDTPKLARRGGRAAA
jgi:hypothetical protein